MQRLYQEILRKTSERGEEMNTTEKKLQKRINTIIQLSSTYPEQLEVTKEEYEQIGQDTFMGVKLKIREEK